MTAGEVFIKVRNYLKDTGKDIFSDWEIYEGINDALRLFAEESAKAGDDKGYFSNTESLVLTNKKVALPTDFVRIKRAFDSSGKELLHIFDHEPNLGEVRILGNTLSSGESSLTLNYYCYPPTVSMYNDAIDLPSSMLLPFSKAAACCVSNTDQAAIMVAQYFNGEKIQVSQPTTGGDNQ